MSTATTAPVARVLQILADAFASQKPEDWKRQYDVVKKLSHPAANLFPFMTPDEMLQLASDIMHNGLVHPIRGRDLQVVTDENGPKVVGGAITDGRNRYSVIRATNRAIAVYNAEAGEGEKLSFVDLKAESDAGADHEIFSSIISENLARRHLSASQKVAVFMKAEKYVEVLSKRAEVKEAGKKLKGNFLDMVAQMSGTNRVYAAKVKKLKDAKRDDLIDQLIAGELSVQQAMREFEGIPDAPPADDSTGEVAVRVQDGLGNDVAEEFIEVFAARDVFTAQLKAISEVGKQLKALAKLPGGVHLSEAEATAAVKTLGRQVKDSMPHAVCPTCHGKNGKGKPCPTCGGARVLTKPQYDRYTATGSAEVAPEAVETADEPAPE